MEEFITNNPMKNPEKLLEEMMIAYDTKLMKLCFTYVKDRKVAEDITQEVFLSFYNKLDEFDHFNHIKTWLYTVAVNKCKDYLRSWSYRKLLLFPTTPIVSTTKDKTIDEKLIANEENSRLARYVFTLPVKYRELIILFYFEDLSIKEICHILKLNENTVRTRMRRGKAILKEELEKGEFGRG